MSAAGRRPSTTERTKDQNDVTTDDEESPASDPHPPLSPAVAAVYPQVDLTKIDARLNQSYADRIPPGSFDVIVERVENGSALCALDIRRDEFTSFVDANLGSAADFTLDHVRLFPRDRQPVVVARHAPTGFTTPIDPNQIGTGLRYPQLRSLVAGTGWRFTIAGADRRRLLLELTQTAATIAALGRLAGDRTPYRTSGTIVDVYLDAVHIKLALDGERLRADDPPIVIKVSAKDLPQVPERIHLGATVDVVLSWRSRHESVSIEDLLRGRPDVRIPMGPWEQQGDKLAATGPLTVADWERLSSMSDQIEDAVEAARYRANVARLAKRSLSHRSARVIDQQSYDDAVQRGTDDVVVTAVLDNGAVLVTTPLGEQFVPARQASMLLLGGSALTVGTRVPVFYTAGGEGLGTVNTRFFDPSARDHLNAGDLVLCRLGGLTAKGGERHVHTETGVEGLVERRSLPGAAEEGDLIPLRIVSIPEEGAVRMSGRYIKQRIALTDASAAALQRSMPGRREPWDLRAFADLADGRVDIDLEYADGRSAQMSGAENANDTPTFLVTYRRCTDDDINAATRVRAAMTGHFAIQPVPHFGPLRADRRAALRAISDQHSCILIDGRVTLDDGRYENVVWIMGPSEDAVVASAGQITDEFPPVWTSDWFKRTGAQWQAAREAVRDLPGRLRSEKSLNEYGKPVFRAIIDCPESDLLTLLAAARAECPDIPAGTFERNPDLGPCDFLTTSAGRDTGDQHWESAVQVAVSSAGPGHLELWAVRHDNQLWHCWWPHDGRWSTWQVMDMPPNSSPRSVVACAKAEWLQYVLLADRDGTTYTRHFDHGWSAWERMQLGGVSVVAMSSAAQGHLEMWAVAAGYLVHRWTSSSGWSAWTQMDLPDGARAVSVAAGSREPGHQQLLVADDTGRCWTRAWEPGGWRPWTHAGVDDALAVGASSAGTGHLEMWVVQTHGDIRHRWWPQDGEWSPWYIMDHPVGSGLVSVAGGSSAQSIHQILAMDSGGQLWHRYWAGEWQPWNAVF